MSDSEEDNNTSSSTPSAHTWPVTVEWLTNVLRQHHYGSNNASGGDDNNASTEAQVQQDNVDDIHIVEFTVRPGCDTGESVLSDIIAVNVEYRIGNDNPKHGTSTSNAAAAAAAAVAIQFVSFIIKLLPQDPFSRFFVTEAQFDLREIKFYTQVVPDLERFQKQHLIPDATPITLPIPRCYHAHYSAGSTGNEEDSSSPQPPESVLVLENIKPAGYTSADFSRGLTLRQTRAAIQAIGRVHALSLCLKMKEGQVLSERYPFLFQTSKATDSYQQLVERGLPQLASFLERRPGLESVLQSLNSIRTNTKELIAALLAPVEPLALITHTDFWCNNLMFKETTLSSSTTMTTTTTTTTATNDATICAILDWQMVTYSRPTNDLALLLVSSVPSELRRLHTKSLLDDYWTTLTECCQKLNVDIEKEHGYTRQCLSDDYRRSQLLALLLCIGSVDVALGDPLTEQRLLDVLHDLDKDGVLCSDIITTLGAEAAAAAAAAATTATTGGSTATTSILDLESNHDASAV